MKTFPASSILARRSILVVMLAASIVSTMACAAKDADPADEPAAGESSESALVGPTGPIRHAILDGLRARVTRDFTNAESLHGYTLVFDVGQFATDSKKAFIVARLMKRENATGVVRELAPADYHGSAYEEQIAQGFFDGPVVFAALEHDPVTGSWSVMSKSVPGSFGGTERYEAYAFGPTDVADATWWYEFDFPRAWIGETAEDPLR